jgi:hypothetical protein
LNIELDNLIGFHLKIIFCRSIQVQLHTETGS